MYTRYRYVCMNIFYIPPHCNVVSVLIRELEQRALISKQLVVFSSHEADTLSHTFSEAKILSLGEKPLFDCDKQLRLAQHLYEKFSKRHDLSMKRAIILADDLLEVARLNSITKTSFEDILIGNAPQHVEEILEYLPEVINFIEAFDIRQVDDSSIVILSPTSNWQYWQVQELMSKPDATLILCGVDLDVASDVWSALDEFHPLFIYKELFDQLKIPTENALRLADNCDGNRSNILNKLFYPASISSEWSNITLEEFNQIDGIEYLECNSIREEALAVLLKAKAMLNSDEQDIAIVAQDKNLIKIILSLAPLFQIKIANHHPMLFSESNGMLFLKLLFNSALESFNPASLLAILKHECFILKDANILQQLEIKYLRGICKYDSLDSLIGLVTEPDIKTFLSEFRVKLSPLIELLSKEVVSFKELLDASLQAVISISSFSISDFECLHLESCDNLIRAQDFLTALFALIKRFEQKRELNAGAKVSLIPFELCGFCECKNIIFTGLNSSAELESSAGIMRDVSDIIGIPYATCDELDQGMLLYFLMHKKNVLLTRSTIISRVPQLQSKWLARLKLLEKKFNSDLKANYLLKQAAELYAPNEFVNYLPPNPSPQISPRLTRLSVSQVERLMKNPYSVYAQCLLKLKPLPDIDAQITQATFGQLVHAVINEFSRSYDNAMSDDEQLEIFNACAERVIYASFGENKFKSLLLLKLHTIAEWIIDFEKTRGAKSVYTEVHGSINIVLDGCEVKLTCIADRIEVDGDQVAIIDFKTGMLPANKDIKNYTSPQLPLMALVLRSGGFSCIKPTAMLRSLSYIRLNSSSSFGQAMKVAGDLDTIVEEADRGLKTLVDFYNSTSNAFKSSIETGYEQIYNDYAHLERVKELI